MAEDRPQRRLAAILAADVVGYSALMEADEEAALRTLKGHRELIDGLIFRHQGRVFGAAGDSVMAEFASAVEAVRAAIAIQEEVAARNAEKPAGGRMTFRIGVNLGDVMVDGGNLFGDGVNVAARLEGLCAPGEVYISNSVLAQVEGKLRLAFEDKGEQSVKNIARPVRVYQVRSEAASGAGPTAAREALPLPDKPSIAVLPFSNMSGDPEQDYFSDGITEDVITELSKISGLFVIARNSSFVYKGSPVSVRQVGQELGVRYVLEGSVRKAGNRLRITAQLIDAATDHHLWVDRYDRELEDIFAVQDEVARKVADALEVELTARERKQAEQRYTENMEAYDCFLRGRSYEARSTKDSNLLARKMFERAIELDPDFAGAYAILSHTHWRDWRNQWGHDPHPLDRALEAAEKAVALDDSLPLAHAYLAWIYVFRSQHDKAIAEGRRAIALDSGFAEGYGRLGLILSLSGEPEAAVDAVRTAMRLDPHYPPNYLIYLGHAYYATGKYEQAIAALKDSLARNPEAMGCNTLLAVIYGELGRTEEAN
ncbi:MAG: tetratricopeptide repeat protein, partial [Alphaproteobacteria bacterium]|nr:tetratricopeptide repeat protein [Alphaproteobacteria bacterium]